MNANRCSNPGRSDNRHDLAAATPRAGGLAARRCAALSRVGGFSLLLLLSTAIGSIAGCPVSNKPAADDPLSTGSTSQSTTAAPGADSTRLAQQSFIEGGGPLRSRLIVTPETLLLTGLDERAQLSAMIVDTDGKLRPAKAEWRSSDESILRIDADGQAIAMAELGSAQIFATAEGLTASPTLAVIAKPAAGALLVQDRQVLGQPAAVDADAEFGVGFRMRARMTADAAPAAGQILIGNGDQPIAGRVVEATAADDGAFDVIFEIRPVDELFEQIRIDQSIDMSHAEYRIPQETLDAYAVEELPDGTLVYFARHDDRGDADKSAAAAKAMSRAQAQGSRVQGTGEGGMECNYQGEIKIGSIKPSIEFRSDLRLDVQLSGDVKRFIVTAELAPKLTLTPELKPGFAGKLSCRKDLKVVKIPVGGWLALLLGGYVPLGFGMELGGSVTAAESLRLDISGEARVTGRVGVEGTALGYHMVNELHGDSGVSFKPRLPSDLTSFNVKLNAQVFAYAEVELGPVIKKLRARVFDIKGGPKLTLDLASMEQQIRDPAYASHIKLSPLNITAGAGSSIRTLQGLLKISFVELKILDTDLLPVIRSPQAAFAIAPESVRPGNDQEVGDLAAFTAQFDKSTFLAMEAIDRVEFVWIRDGHADAGRPGCRELAAAAGQTRFACEADFREEHEGPQTFHVFYYPKLFGITLPIPFEAADHAAATVIVQPQTVAGVTVIRRPVIRVLSGATAEADNQVGQSSFEHFEDGYSGAEFTHHDPVSESRSVAASAAESGTGGRTANASSVASGAFTSSVSSKGHNRVRLIEGSVTAAAQASANCIGTGTSAFAGSNGTAIDRFHLTVDAPVTVRIRAGGSASGNPRNGRAGVRISLSGFEHFGELDFRYGGRAERAFGSIDQELLLQPGTHTLMVSAHCDLSRPFSVPGETWGGSGQAALHYSIEFMP
ncbi:MAG: hypothetical protein HRU75_06040 [Planctomycetia bacterium]|nr:MAG: hypothetical protein HRU75_06040 [Planctomycetia bacterium]